MSKLRGTPGVKAGYRLMMLAVLWVQEASAADQMWRKHASSLRLADEVSANLSVTFNGNTAKMKVSFRSPNWFKYEAPFGIYDTVKGEVCFADHKTGQLITYPYEVKEHPYGIFHAQFGPVVRTGEHTWAAIAVAGLEPVFMKKAPDPTDVKSAKWGDVRTRAYLVVPRSNLEVRVHLNAETGELMGAEMTQYMEKQPRPNITRIEYGDLKIT